MFTGIVTDIGVIAAVNSLPSGKRFRIETGYDVATIDIGASIAHAGVCLTVTAKADKGNWYEVETWDEALRLTTASSWQVGGRVNLERALKIGDELGGHMISGHVDGTGEVVSVVEDGGARRFCFHAPNRLARFIAAKGSVALDGTSLTVNQVDGAEFDCLLIAHSLSVTTWSNVVAGDNINLEVDLMARYVARLAEYKEPA